MKDIFVINGSASDNSSNQKLIHHIADLTKGFFSLTVFNGLKTLPHFVPELSTNNPPSEIIELRKSIEQADGIIICTPEYVFSIPSGLKNAIEWCVSATVFSDKPTGLITASANGEKGHEELQLILKTMMAKFTEKTSLLIQGVKGKFDTQGNLMDNDTQKQLDRLIYALVDLIDEKQ